MTEIADCDPFRSSTDLTRLLKRWGEGDAGAGNQLMPLVYRRLHEIASRLVWSRPGALELQPTELVAEAWLKLNRSGLEVVHRDHFLALSARVMRQVLTDHARRLIADKRGGEWQRTTISQLGADPTAVPLDLIELDQGLNQLAGLHPRAASAIELHYFGGLSDAEAAACLAVSSRTLERDLRFGRAWLKERMHVS